MKYMTALDIRYVDPALSPDEVEQSIIENYACPMWVDTYIRQAALVNDDGTIAWLPFPENEFEAFLMGLHGSEFWSTSAGGIAGDNYDCWQHGLSFRDAWLAKTRWSRRLPLIILVLTVLTTVLLAPR